VEAVKVIDDTVIQESDGTLIGDFVTTDLAIEGAKRINMHDELVKSLQFLTGIVGGNFCQDMVIKRKYKEARELLEKYK
jgi:hypothetical protein